MHSFHVLKFLSVGAMVWIATVISCCDDPEPDRCKGQLQVHGGFSMGERLEVAGKDTLLISDTVLTGNPIVFEADTDYVSYEWKIGNDARIFDTKTVTLTFPAAENNINVSLIAKWNKNSKCFPNDDGIDTIIHQLTVINRIENPIFGTYAGADASSPSNVFNVQISHVNSYQKILITNLNEGCDPIEPSFGLEGFYSDMGYKKLFFTGYYINNCRNPEGVATIDQAGKGIKIDYTIGNGTEANGFNETIRTKETFIGTKVN
jgi:hypothetical protein